MFSHLSAMVRGLLAGETTGQIALEAFFPEIADDTSPKLKLVAGRAGPDARVVQVTRTPKIWKRLETRPIGAADAYSFPSDLARLLQAAKEVSRANFVVYRANGGLPLPFTVNMDDDGPIPVCYSVPATTYAYYLNHTLTEYSVRQGTWKGERCPDGFEFGDQARRICLRLLGDHFLHRGELLPAIACVGAAHDFRPTSHHLKDDHGAKPVLHDPLLRASPPADELSHYQWRRLQEPVFYFPLWFFSFAHELGHRADADLVPSIFESPNLSEVMTLARLERSVRATEVDWSARAGVNSWESGDQGVLGEITKLLRIKAPLWVGELRSEILADHVAVQLIWQACVGASAEQRGKRPSIDAFFTDAVMSLVYLLVCQTVARAISLDALRSTDNVQGLVAFFRYSFSTAIRLETLIDTLTLSPRVVAIEISGKEQKRLANLARGLGEVGRALVQCSLDCVDRVGHARRVSADELLRHLKQIDPTRYFVSPDIEFFWGAVDRMGLWETTDLIRNELVEYKAERSRLRALRDEAESRRAV